MFSREGVIETTLLPTCHCCRRWCFIQILMTSLSDTFVHGAKIQQRVKLHVPDTHRHVVAGCNVAKARRRQMSGIAIHLLYLFGTRLCLSRHDERGRQTNMDIGLLHNAGPHSQRRAATLRASDQPGHFHRPVPTLSPSLSQYPGSEARGHFQCMVCVSCS